MDERVKVRRDACHAVGVAVRNDGGQVIEAHFGRVLAHIERLDARVSTLEFKQLSAPRAALAVARSAQTAAPLPGSNAARWSSASPLAGGARTTRYNTVPSCARWLATAQTRARGRLCERVSSLATERSHNP